jgi:TRAP-type C4-dicarboxylate transport system permease small subunit
VSYGTPPPPPPPEYGAPGPYGAAPVGNNKKAIWSLVTGIVGLLCCGILGIVAIVLAQQAKKEIATTGQQGGGMATAGLVLGVIAVIFMVVNLILALSGNSIYNNL